MKPQRIIPLDINYVHIEFPQEISPEVNRGVSELTNLLRCALGAHLLSIIPSYAAILLEYDPAKLELAELMKVIEKAISEMGKSEETAAPRKYLPVLYGGESGPDMARVAEHCKMTEEEIISRHSNTVYQVYMLGFNPGFPYLGGMEKDLAVPRLTTPRVRIPAGSVAIGGEQTGVYSLAAPGGWNIIGLTPLNLFDPANNPPALLAAGDEVVFIPVSEAEFNAFKIDPEATMEKLKQEGRHERN